MAEAFNLSKCNIFQSTCIVCSHLPVPPITLWQSCLSKESLGIDEITSNQRERFVELHDAKKQNKAKKTKEFNLEDHIFKFLYPALMKLNLNWTVTIRKKHSFYPSCQWITYNIPAGYGRIFPIKDLIIIIKDINLFSPHILRTMNLDTQCDFTPCSLFQKWVRFHPGSVHLASSEQSKHILSWDQNGISPLAVTIQSDLFAV